MIVVNPENPYIVSILPSIGCFLMMLQVFYWLELFEQTSFYVTMVFESLDDIKYFLFMVAVSIWSFAIAFTVLDHN